MGRRTKAIIFLFVPVILLAAVYAISGGEPAKPGDGGPAAPPTAAAPLGENESGIDRTLPEDVIATVNGIPITRKEFIEKLVLRYGWQNLRQAVDMMVVEEEAKRLGVSATDAEIDVEVEKVVQDHLLRNFGEDKVKAERFLYDNYFYDLDMFRKYVRDDCACQVLLHKVVLLRAGSDEKVKKLFEEKYGKERGEMVRARRIMTATEDEAKKILARIKAGENFEKIAESQENIATNTRANGGDTGFFGKGDKYIALENAAFALPVGAISEPVKGAFGWHIIKVVEKRPAGGVKFEEVKDVLVTEVAKKTELTLMRSIPQELGKKAVVKENLYPSRKLDRKRSDAPMPGHGHGEEGGE
jgi:foldase protein PrsA